MSESDQKIPALEWTGERYLPGVEGDIAIEHLHRYALARELVHGKDVLDIACGEGYGSHLLMCTARSVLGVDVADDAVLHARSRYVQSGIRFEVGSCSKIPSPDNSIDVVVCFETIEHHDQHKEMLAEIKRVLRPSGCLIISSPDKHEYSDVPGNVNPFHVKELYLNEFHDLLLGYFRHVALYGQRVAYGSIVAPIDSRAAVWSSFSGAPETVRAIPGIERPLYFIAIASDASDVSLPAGIFSDSEALSRRDQQIRALEQSMARLQTEIIERAAQAASLNATVEDRNTRVALLNQGVATRDDELVRLRAQITQLEENLTILQNQSAQLQMELKDVQGELNSALREMASLRELAVLQNRTAQLAVVLKDAQSELNNAQLQIASLNEIVRGRESRIASLNEGIEIRDSYIDKLNEMLNTANLTIARITESRSWRLTQPLREFRSILAKREVPEVQPQHDPPTPGPPSLVPLQTEPSEPDPERDSFDADLYLKLYSDVRLHFKGHPYLHYVAHGKAEGRLAFLSPLEYSGDFANLNSQRETVLVVSHEASRTGAPVLSLNIAQELKKRYNVIVLLLNGGSMVDAFKASADIVVGPIGRIPDLATTTQVARLLSKCRIKFAIVNSAESRGTLPELARQFVPSVALIHEFASNTRPRDGIEKVVYWASKTVFSADVVLDNALSAFPGLGERRPLVIPQGKCSLPENPADLSSESSEAEHIERTFRPPGWPPDTIVVLGVGSVHLRKGVDLFVACAAKVLQSAGGRSCRFVWIGRGYDPEFDTAYSLYLEDQVRRANLSNNFVFMNETSRLDLAYEQADILVLSSRLDPLPNVTVDAMFHRLPFACFDKATGVADILKKSGLANECVAPYLDVEGLASRVLAFIASPDLRRSVGDRLKEVADVVFDMTKYVERLENVALQCCLITAQETADCSVIAGCDLLDLDYLAGSDASTIRRDQAIRRFVRSWSNGFLRRKPFAGFHPGIYQEQCGSNEFQSNPLADYLRAGSPKGPWSFETIGPVEEPTNAKATLTAALHLHLFYPEFCPIIIERLNANRMRPDLFISVPSDEVMDQVKSIVKDYKGTVREIRVVPNRGRDIGALLTEFGRATAKYDLIGHFHSKKTADLPDDAVGKNWFTFLLENLIGGRYKMADIILERMTSDPSIGLVFPDDPYVVGWSNNQQHALPLAAKMGIQTLPKTHFNFPVGTMFWARSSAMKPMVDLGLDWDDYPTEPLGYDGTVLHALERLLPFVAEKSGFRVVVTNVPGITR